MTIEKCKGKYIGWERREKWRKTSEGGETVPCFEVYVFKDPEEEEWDTGYTSLRALGKNVVYCKIDIEGNIQQIPSGGGIGKGFEKYCYCKIKGPEDLTELSEKIGISKEQLEEILSKPAYISDYPNI